MPIHYNEHGRMWILETDKTAYVFGVNSHNRLQHVYWGERLPFDSDYRFKVTDRFGTSDKAAEVIHEEYPGWAGMYYSEPCLKAEFADGVRNVILEYKGYTLANGDQPELIVELQDPYYDVVVRLHYVLYESYDLLGRYAEVVNTGNAPIQLESVQSAAWTLPGNLDYRFTHLSGKWCAETQLRQVPLTNGKTVIESRRGNTSAQANPWFALDHGRATETEGTVWFGALAWSGNWQIVAELNSCHEVRVTGGFNAFDFGWQLQPGEVLRAPLFIAGCTNEGFGQASRSLHRYQLEHVLPAGHANQLRNVLYNSWEAVLFDVTEDKQVQIAEKAASLGIELFVIDDGWFGARDHDSAGLGDWVPSKTKFPNGLGPLIKRVNELGMDFGIWVEPEMVNPDSDLYRAHPDWVLSFPNRPRTESRHQLVLNLGKDEVREYLWNSLHGLLSEHPIRFVKWDMNRYFSEPGWMELPEGRRKEVWTRYVFGLYELLDRIKQAFPEVEIESCSSGGGRLDLGILERTDQVWTSDNTNALDRLSIQEGYSYAYAPKTMAAWVTDNAADRISLQYRFLSAMMGNLGVGANLHRWGEEEFGEARHWIAVYKEIRSIVQHGDLYRLLTLRDGQVSATQYVSRDRKESVVFVLTSHLHPADLQPPLYLQGLEPDALYEVEGTRQPFSGKALKLQGIPLPVSGILDSKLIRVRIVE